MSRQTIYAALCTGLMFFICFEVSAQNVATGSIVVRLITADREKIADAHISLINTSFATRSDSTGSGQISGIPAGRYVLEVTHVGYDTEHERKIEITAGKETNVEVLMRPAVQMLDEVVIQTAPFKQGFEVPVSLYSLATAEIRRNPGSDNDISKVMRSMPGVATTSSFRNDLIIRGGAPNENRFYLDEVEIPVINHLVTQGASGGAYSMLNSNLLREVDYMSSSFPANRGNALSSVYQFSLRDGRSDSAKFTMNMGGTDAGLIVETPVGEKSGLLFSARRSYRQNILKLLRFAFLPVYNDMVFKYTTRLAPHTVISVVGIGALDNFKLNSDVGNNEIQRYLLENLPASKQSNYTTGLVLKHFTDTRSMTLVASRSYLGNSAEKYYLNNTENPDGLILRYKSTEASNRLRGEMAWHAGNWRLLVGGSLEENIGTYDVFNRIVNQYGPVNVGYDSDIRFIQYGAFMQWNMQWLDEKIQLVAGLRADGSNYNAAMQDLSDHMGGRLSLTVRLSDRVSIAAGAADYFQMPPMMTLSYRNSGELDNLETARYLKSRHYTAGFKWTNRFAGRLSLEGFYKSYPGYLMSLRDSISLAHVPVDFGVFGNFPIDHRSEGRAYGVEVFYQQRLYRGYYGMAAYTLSRSEYKDKAGLYRPATWDARHIMSLTLGKKINAKWEVGMSWRLQSALPYTPFNTGLSSSKVIWDVNNQGIRDYSQLNEFRGKATNLINLRIDRVYRFPRFALNLYMDIENLLADADSQQVMILDRTADNLAIIENPEAPLEQQQYKIRQLANAQGALIPTFGMILKF